MHAKMARRRMPSVHHTQGAKDARVGLFARCSQTPQDALCIVAMIGTSRASHAPMA